VLSARWTAARAVWHNTVSTATGAARDYLDAHPGANQVGVLHRPSAGVLRAARNSGSDRRHPASVQRDGASARSCVCVRPVHGWLSSEGRANAEGDSPNRGATSMNWLRTCWGALAQSDEDALGEAEHPGLGDVAINGLWIHAWRLSCMDVLSRWLPSCPRRSLQLWKALNCKDFGGRPRHCRCVVAGACCGVRSVRDRQWGVCFQVRAALLVAADQLKLVELI
jgi:hypothetical protein